MSLDQTGCRDLSIYASRKERPAFSLALLKRKTWLLSKWSMFSAADTSLSIYCDSKWNIVPAKKRLTLELRSP